MTIREALRQRILVLDGAMGTCIQQRSVDPLAFHRGPFSAWSIPLTGNNEVLNITAPHVIEDIHRSYIEAGADIISTNTFSANRISQQEYRCEQMVRRMAFEGARIARKAADSQSHHQVWVAGSMGPTAKSLSMTNDNEDQGNSGLDFDQLAEAYYEQAEALAEGGVDLFLLETCYDALNAKAALYAIQQLKERTGRNWEVMVSATVNDRSGRTLTGQTLEAFFVSVSHEPLLSFGLNCSFGVAEMEPIVERIASRIPLYFSIHPNAGLPNALGAYEDSPEYMAAKLKSMAENGHLNIVGGCCGTDERHIRAIKEAVEGVKPRRCPEPDPKLWVAGLEAVVIDKATRNFTYIGERTNVAGSRKFARLIAGKQYEEALTVARQQIEGGANIIDINMDDSMIDGTREMRTFLQYIAADPSVAKTPLMIDSSNWDTILAGLKSAQGKCIVNSISLKEGELVFLQKAKELKRLGAAAVVMAFDEQGQATTFERKIAIVQRANNLLTGIGFRPSDIIFDVNILAVGTGIDEHAAYGIDFIRAVAWIKQNLPDTLTSGGVSNLSFAFRGNNVVRQAMHAAFLYHAIHAGLDMAIVNPTMLQVYDNIDPQLLVAVEAVVLNRHPDATARLMALADQLKSEQEQLKTEADGTRPTSDGAAWRQWNVSERVAYSLCQGITDSIEADMKDALDQCGGRAVEVVESILMEGMKRVGTLFAEGKMFLPQVVKAAKVMKMMVDVLQPYMEEQKTSSTTSSQPVVVMATANGDVHDIGKNIVDIVLSCNNFKVHDLGVMVANDAILEAAQKLHPVAVGVSGLITPSLQEMEALCRLFQQHRMRVPIVVGGATTSAVHTAVRLAPIYDGGVVYGGDASTTAVIMKQLETNTPDYMATVQEEQRRIRENYERRDDPITPFEMANKQAKPFVPVDDFLCPPSISIHLSATDLEPIVNWSMFLQFWGFRGYALNQQLTNPEARRTLTEGKNWLHNADSSGRLSVEVLYHPEMVVRQGNDLVFEDGSILPMLRSQNEKNGFRSLVDFFDDRNPRPLGLFVVVAKPIGDFRDEEDKIYSHAIRARLTEAAAEWLQHEVYGDRPVHRAAFGYPSCPDHALKRIVFDRLGAEEKLGITLTDHYSILPSTAICGLFIDHPSARPFALGRIGDDQQTDYNQRITQMIFRLKR